ncbi:MAG: ATP-dependent Clp protease proteolytic subunit [Reyranellaceae bacterium]
MPPFDDLIRDTIEDIENKQRSLTVILETGGGYIETAERIADTLRWHYPREINFIVPNQAMSAGTVLVMCGDNILMDYYSTLGPIDPQIRNKMNEADFIPALGYLAKFDELMEKSAQGTLTEAEMAYLVAKFDPAELHQFEQARQLSVDLLQKWLVQYKFRKWRKTQTRGQRVTIKMKKERAAEIAMKLNAIEKWKSHARGISKEIVENDLKLTVRDFGAEEGLNRAIRAYYRLMQDYMQRRAHQMVVHTRHTYVGF